MAFCVVLITASSDAEAGKLARMMVESELAACVNLVPGVRSIYRWQGKVEEAAEVLLIAKTVKTRVKELVRAVKKAHSASVPEVIALAIKGGSRDYLKWVGENSGGVRPRTPARSPRL